MTAAAFEPILTPEHHRFWLIHGYLVQRNFIYEKVFASLRNRATESLNLKAAIQGYSGLKGR